MPAKYIRRTIKNGISTAYFGKKVLPDCFTNSHSSYPLKMKTWKKAAMSLQEFAQGWQDDRSLALPTTWGFQILLEKGHSLTSLIAFCRPLRKLLWDGYFGHFICNHLYHMYHTFCSSVVYCVGMGEGCELFAKTNILLYTSDPGRVMLIYTAEELSHGV